MFPHGAEITSKLFRTRRYKEIRTQLCQLRNAINAVHELEKCSLVRPGGPIKSPIRPSRMPLRFKGRAIYIYFIRTDIRIKDTLGPTPLCVRVYI